jgi:hypothetical protein
MFLVLMASQTAARADVVLDWNARAVATAAGQNPFNQARLLAIVQLAVFEAVNAVTGDYEGYTGEVTAAPDASEEAAAIAAAHTTLLAYFPGSAAALDAARASSLAAVADGPAKDAGIAAGEAAAAAMIARRATDRSAPPDFHFPSSALAGEWQLTPTCFRPDGTPTGGAFYHWSTVTPFGIPRAADFIIGPPPDLGSNRYAKDFADVKAFGGAASATRPPDRTGVAQFYASASPTQLLNEAARQLSAARGDSLSENARALALLNMAISDSLVVSFATKYRYNFWRPETAIHAADSDGNAKTEPDSAFAPLIATPCFPSYPSNHAAGTNGGLEVLRRLYGAAGHSLALTNTLLGVTRHYTALNQIADSVDDARVYGGIHFWFDQDAGRRLGREVATYVYKHNLAKQ